MVSRNRITNIVIEKFFDDETNKDFKKKLYGCLLIRFNNKIYKIL